MLDESSTCIFPSLHIAAGQHSPLADGVAARVRQVPPEKRLGERVVGREGGELGQGASLQF